MVDAVNALRPADAVQAGASSGASPELADAAQQFESLLLHMMIKSMRESVPKSDLFGDSQHTESYEMLRDQELAKTMASSGGIGFAKMIVAQFEGREEEGLRTLTNMGQELRSASDSYRTYGAPVVPSLVDGGDR